MLSMFISAPHFPFFGSLFAHILKTKLSPPRPRAIVCRQYLDNGWHSLSKKSPSFYGEKKTFLLRAIRGYFWRCRRFSA